MHRFSSTRIMLHETQGPVMPSSHPRYNKLGFRNTYWYILWKHQSVLRCLSHFYRFRSETFRDRNKFENQSKLNEPSRRTLMPIIDASKTGNLGRFFNHSCSPNIGIQNVFTNHHDIRYPHTSFFTLRNIKAGEELCWHYGYVNTGTKECYCGTKACNGYYA